MAWNWAQLQLLGDEVTPEWAEEVRNAILQIAKDLYTDPVNNGDGSPLLVDPVEELVGSGSGALATGEISGPGPSGASVDISALGLSLPGDYRVMLSWEGDPGAAAGYCWYDTKTATSFIVHNSDDATAGKIVWAVFGTA